MKAFKILLVEDSAADLYVFRELVARLDLLPYWRLWKRSTEVLVVDLAEDAIDVALSEQIDLILFSFAPEAERGFAAFLKLREEAPDVPCIVMAARQDETMALAAVREGAQDYLLKSEIDCASLARAFRYALERHRLTQALRSLSPLDDLTGLYHRTAFLTLLDHDMEVVSGLGHKAVLLFVALEGMERIRARQRRELLLLDLAETLRATLPTGVLAGRTGEYEFAFLVAGSIAGAQPEKTMREIMESWQCSSGHQVSARVASSETEGRSGDDLLSFAKQRLCETKAYPMLPQQ